ncbi:major facilitator superfamily domain-containing protein 6-like [Lytechinus variegatus]|uniref:major facilitator superfamily domain-containing protein 6-like n=1 Tax=Lytechinus variegatus TaxID=7654 RepID=UPI001BB15EAC|nr:major facilitator superfamily domain-containing protein 6-like [Lytechinus variegatus]
MTNQKKFDEKGVDYILGDSEIVSLSSRVSDGDDEDHFFIDHDQVNKNDVHGSNSAGVIELEPLSQPLNGRRCRAETHEDVGIDTDNEHNRGKYGGVDHSEDQPKKNGTRIFLAVKTTHFLFGGGQLFGIFYRQHLNMTTGIPTCKSQNATYSEFKEFVDENACKSSNIKILNTSTAAAFLEDILECSFTGLATDTDSDRENRGDENVDGGAPDDTYEYKETGQNFQYGRQRMFASIAYGALAPLSGIAVSAYTAAHPNAFNVYLPAFVLFVTLFALCTATVSFIPIRVKQRTTKSLAMDAKDVLLKPKVIVFFTVMLSMGIMFAFFETYLFLFLAEIDGEATVMGLCLTVSCSSEVVLMMYASKIREKIGHRTVLGIALIGFSLRSVGYSLLQNPWTVLPIELLHGITHGSMWPNAVFFIHQSSPPELAATMQSLTFSTFFGLGKGVGIILGGVIYDNFGARNLFRGSAILSFVTLVLYCVIDIILDKREISHDKL